MEFNIKKLEENLQQFKVEGKASRSRNNDTGTSKFIQYVWNQTPTSDVNFNSFELNDGLRAFYEFYSLPHGDDEVSPSEILAINNTMWEKNALMDNVIYSIIKQDKVFPDDEENFI